MATAGDDLETRFWANAAIQAQIAEAEQHPETRVLRPGRRGVAED